MPPFERFSRDMLALKNDPQLTIHRRGTISLNKSAYVALGSPVSVELLYDAAEQIVGLRFIDPREHHAYPVRHSGPRGPFVISAMAYTRFYDIDTTQTLRFTAHLIEGILCVTLTDPAMPINRAHGRRSIAGQHHHHRPADEPEDSHEESAE